MILVDVLDDEIDSPRILGLIDRFADQLDACGTSRSLMTDDFPIPS
jgi:hypothetical protein